MNQPITRLFLLVLVMFALLVGFTSRWSVFEASALRNNPENARPGLEAQRVQRGAILAADGTTVLAQSVRQSDGVYQREYPQGAVFAAPIGYYDPYNGSYQLEQYRTGALTGTPAQQSSLLDQLEDKQTSGDEVITTLDAHAQQVAMTALAGRARGRRRDRPLDGGDPRDGEQSELQPERDQEHQGARRARARGRSAAARPRGGGAVRPRLDLQGRDRDGGDRQRPLHAELDHQRRLADHRRQPAASERRRLQLRSRHAELRAHQLDQHRLRAGRAEGRRPEAPDLHAAVRLLPADPDRSARRRDRAERRTSTPPAGGSPSPPGRTSAARASARAACW